MLRRFFPYHVVLAIAVLALSTAFRESGLNSGVAQAAGKPAVEKTSVGRTASGETVDRYTLTNRHGLEAAVLTYGATLTSVRVPDRQGNFDNVTLYLDSVEDYLKGYPLFGSVVGRFANRIADGRFTIDGTRYDLAAGRNGVHIHGGKLGFQKLVWDAEPVKKNDSAGVALSLVSLDGNEGYPGTLAVTVVYTLNDQNELVMDYTARSDKTTHVNLTNHAYWNLAGATSGDVLRQQLMLNADHYLPADQRKIPTGQLVAVQGTPMDFTTPQEIGSRIAEVPGGYDHCYVLNKPDGQRMSLCARVVDPASGRVMEVHTTQPGVQLYTANGLNDRLSAGGVPYGPHHGFCLETQHYPDSPNKPQFPTTLLTPGETYHQTTVHKFSVGE